MRSLNVWLTSFVILLSACGKPPKGPVGLIGDAGCIMHNPALAEGQQDYTLSFVDCAKAGSIATTPDYDRILRAAFVDCRRPPVGPMCVIGETAVFCNDEREMTRGNVCFGKEIIDGACSLTFTEALNFVVTTSVYFRQLNDYYKRKCE